MSNELGQHRDQWVRVSGVIAPVVAVVGVIVVWLSAWRGVDVPAQVYRVEMFRQYGWLLWDSRWYGGHYLLPYSVLFPPFGAALGLYGAAARRRGGATWAFDRLMRTSSQSRSVVPSLVFAVGTDRAGRDRPVPVSQRRSRGLLAVYAVRTRRRSARSHLRCLLPSSQPGRGRVPRLGAHRVGMGGPRSRRWSLLALAAVTALPLLVLNVSFYEPGRSRSGEVTCVVLVLCALGFFLLPTTSGHCGSRRCCTHGLPLRCSRCPMRSGATSYGSLLPSLPRCSSRGAGCRVAV